MTPPPPPAPARTPCPMAKSVMDHRFFWESPQGRRLAAHPGDMTDRACFNTPSQCLEVTPQGIEEEQVLVNMYEYACVPNVNTLYTTCLHCGPAATLQMDGITHW